MKTYVIKAAGGNPTAIRTIKNQLTRKQFEKFGADLMLETESFGVEQAGFLVQKDSQFHFEMSGGEFCGNAARSAALVISQITGKPENSFTMSGYKGVVQSHVDGNNVRCEFKGLPTLKKESLFNGAKLTVVDLGGIVHVVIEDEFPENYKIVHKQITQELGLQNRDAVGVLWIQKNGKSVNLNPVVWVKSIDTFFYETACGSGSIAVVKATGVKEVTQPSGQVINATITKDSVVLESAMEIVFEKTDTIKYTLVFDLDSKYKQEFISMYKDVFSEAPYFETYEDSWVEENIWNLHIESGCLFLALHNDHVVGFGAAIPVYLDQKVYDFLNKQKNLPFDLKSTFYMSELAVASPFRKSDLHIGSMLVKKRIECAKEIGFKTYVMRTAMQDSNSKNLYTNIIGAKVLQGAVQDVEENPEEVESASKHRIYLYGNTG